MKYKYLLSTFFLVITIKMMGQDIENKTVIQYTTQQGYFINHTLEAGQTLYNISKKFGIPVSEIIEVNAIKDLTDIDVNTSLVLPVALEAFIPLSRTKSTENTSLYYKVKPKESIYHICKRLFPNDISIFTAAQSPPIVDNILSPDQYVLVGYLDIAKKEVPNTAVQSTSINASENITADTRSQKVVLVSQNQEISTEITGTASTSVIDNPIEEHKQIVEIKKDSVEESNKDVEETTNKSMELEEDVSENSDVANGPSEEMEDIAETSEVVRAVNVVNSANYHRGLAFYDKQDDDQGRFFVLHSKAKPGSMIELRNPMSGRRAMVKVVGSVPSKFYNSEITVVISKTVAQALGVLDSRVRLDQWY